MTAVFVNTPAMVSAVARRSPTPAEFEIQVDAKRVAAQTLRLADPHRFFDLEYPVPAELVRGKSKVTVRFEAKAGSQIATVFGLRMIRGDAAL